MSYQLKAPLFILMHGVPAAGKSAFARQYAQAENLAHINSDKLRFELYDDVQFSPSENKTVFRLAAYISELLIDRSQSLIFDMNLPSQTIRNEMRHKAQRNGFNFLVVWVQTDKEVAMQRAAKRDRRRPDDKYSPAIGHQLFERIANKAGVPNPDREPVAVISGQQAFSHQRRLVDHKLKQLGFANDISLSVKPGRVDYSRRHASSGYDNRR